MAAAGRGWAWVGVRTPLHAEGGDPTRRALLAAAVVILSRRRTTTALVLVKRAIPGAGAFGISGRRFGGRGEVS